jgi:hypothetical protein
LDWTTFLEGYAIGTAQMVLIDGVILFIVWPLREFISVLKDPAVRGRMKLFLGLELSPIESSAMTAKAKGN